MCLPQAVGRPQLHRDMCVSRTVWISSTRSEAVNALGCGEWMNEIPSSRSSTLSAVSWLGTEVDYIVSSGGNGWGVGRS